MDFWTNATMIFFIAKRKCPSLSVYRIGNRIGGAVVATVLQSPDYAPTVWGVECRI